MFHCLLYEHNPLKIFFFFWLDRWVEKIENLHLFGNFFWRFEREI